MPGMLIQSVKRALKVLDMLTFDDILKEGIGLFELAKRMEIQPNTLHNLLKTMASCGYVAQNEKGKYKAGPKCEEWGLLTRLSSNRSLEDIRTEIEGLSKLIEEMVVFTVLSNGSRVPLIKVENSHPVRVDGTSAENENIYEKPTGRVLVAFADECAREAVLERWGYPHGLWDGIKNRKELENALATIKNKGYLTSFESNSEIVCMAFPVFYSDGRLMGALGTYAPVYRCNEEKQKFILEEMSKTAKALSKAF